MLEYSQQSGKPVLIGVELEQKSGELNIKEMQTAEEIGELSQFLKGKSIRLVITSDQVLSKKVSHTGSDAEIIAEAFPNFNGNEFYYQILRSAETSFIAVCRKEYVDKQVQKFKNDGVLITEISLGALKMVALSGYVGDVDVYSNTSKVTFYTDEIVSILSKNENEPEEEYDIEGLIFSSRYTLPISLGLTSVLQNDLISGNIDDENSILKKRYSEVRFFKSGLQLGLGFLLIALLVNFFIFNGKYKKWQSLQEELQVYTSQKQLIDKKVKEVGSKEALVKSIQTTGFSKSSNYINQITQIQPKTVLLNVFTYQPLKKPIRKDKLVDLQKDIISIAGQSTDKVDFTNWLRAIEALSFVESVTIVQYGLHKKQTSDFELTLIIKTDGTTD
ncbi:hypothetical protein [Aquimarina pacifica]|uniref:hypothetical protein n=1 Tax=Aquimarina pacifica TaxID=1296415 RepID=UPI0004B95269|nr:hypothetical protein [Aquimarina pacifica]